MEVVWTVVLGVSEADELEGNDDDVDDGERSAFVLAFDCVSLVAASASLLGLLL